MKKLGKALGGLAVAGAVVAGGSAFTASNTLPAHNAAGYSSVTVTGVQVNALTYTFNAVGDTITNITMELDGNTTDETIDYAFNADNVQTCSDPGTYDAGNDVTDYVCNANQDVAAATAFHLSTKNTN